MGNLGWPEILIILGIALIIFGPRKLPELGKSLGQSLAQFRRASEDFKRTWEEEVEMEKRKLNAMVEDTGAAVSHDDIYEPIQTAAEQGEPAEQSEPAVEQGEAVAQETK